MKILTILILWIYSISLFGQEIPALQPNKTVNGEKEGKWVYWYDENWEGTNHIDSVYSYYVVRYKAGKPKGKSYTYYRNGQILWEGKVYSESPLLRDGESIWYFENGQKKTPWIL